MPLQHMEEMIQAGLDRAVEMMTLAAWNSFRFEKRNTIKMVTATGEELTPVAEYCFSLGDMAPLGARDGRHLAQLIKEPTSMLLIGDKRKSDFNYNCGACGFRTCAELNKSEKAESLTADGPSCMFKNPAMEPKLIRHGRCGIGRNAHVEVFKHTGGAVGESAGVDRKCGCQRRRCRERR